MTFTGADHSDSIQQEPMEVKNEAQICLGGRSAPGSQGSEMPTSSNNVSALVTKSKKAASSLFTLLHAKNCKLGVHRCPHPGCPEAKLIFLHLKTCSVTNSEPCPTEHKGCADSRKLLNHYRRCRDIRSRQVANRSGEPQHICLVCSLVVRHAKGSSERNRSSSPGPKSARGTSRHLIPTLNLSTDGKTDVNNRHRSPSTSPHRDAYQVSTKASQVPMKMPPPPPKFSFSNHFPGSEGICRSRSNPDEENRFTPIEVQLRQRPRAESLDLRRTVQNLDDTSSFHGRAIADKTEESEEQPAAHRRRRSVSCSVPLSSQAVGATFDPILEEPVVNELQEILEGEP